MRQLIQSTAAVIAVANACEYFIGINGPTISQPIDEGIDWTVDFGNIRERISADPACWDSTPGSVELFIYDDADPAVASAVHDYATDAATHVISETQTSTKLVIPAGTKPDSEAHSMTGHYAFELCFKKDSGEADESVCTNKFYMVICKYSTQDWDAPIHHNIYQDLTIDLGGFLSDTANPLYRYSDGGIATLNYVPTCFNPLSLNSQLIFEEVVAPATGYSVLNHASLDSVAHDDFQFTLNGRNPSLSPKADYNIAVCIPKFYSTGRHCITSSIIELECDDNEFKDGPTLQDKVIMHVSGTTLDFGALRTALHVESDCWDSSIGVVLTTGPNFASGQPGTQHPRWSCNDCSDFSTATVLDIDAPETADLPDGSDTTAIQADYQACYYLNANADLSSKWACSKKFNLLECDFTVGSAAEDSSITFDKTYNAFGRGSITTYVKNKIGTDADGCWNMDAGGTLEIDGQTDHVAGYNPDSSMTFELRNHNHATPPTENADLISGEDNSKFCFVDYLNVKRCGPTFQIKQTWDACADRDAADGSLGAFTGSVEDQVWDPRADKEFDFGSLRDGFSEIEGCFGASDGGILYLESDSSKETRATAIEDSATSTKFTFAADATAPAAQTDYEICYFTSETFEGGAAGTSASSPVKVCTGKFAIATCVYNPAAALTAPSINTAITTEIDLGALRNTMLPVGGCWADQATHAGAILFKDEAGDLSALAAVGTDQKITAFTLASTKITIDGYNEGETDPALPGYDVRACFHRFNSNGDQDAQNMVCTDPVVKLTETFNECPVAFTVPSVSGVRKWSVGEDVEFEFGAIRNGVNTNGAADADLCFVDNANILFNTDDSPVAGQTILSQTGSRTAVKLTADDTLTTETKTYKLCYLKKSDGTTKVCTGTFTVLNCAYDETNAVPVINHNRVYDLTVSFGDLKDQINANANCYESMSDMPLMFDDSTRDVNYPYDTSSNTASNTEIVLKGTDLGVGFTPSYHMTSFQYKLCYEDFNRRPKCSTLNSVNTFYYIGFEAYSNDVLNGVVKDLNKGINGGTLNQAIIKEWPAATLNALSAVDLSTTAGRDSITDWEAENPFKIKLIEGTTLVVQLGSSSDSAADLTALAGNAASIEVLYLSGTAADSLELHKDATTASDAILTPQGRVVWADTVLAGKISGTPFSSAFSPEHPVLPAYSFTVPAGTAGDDVVAAIKFCSAADDTVCRVTSIVVESISPPNGFPIRVVEHSSNDNVAMSLGLPLSAFKSYDTAKASKTACSGCDDKVTLYDMRQPTDVFTIEAGAGELLSWKATGSATIEDEQPTKDLDGNYVQNSEELQLVAYNPAAAGSIVLMVPPTASTGDVFYGGLKYIDGSDIYRTGVKVTVATPSLEEFDSQSDLIAAYPGISYAASGNDGSRTNNKWDYDPSGSYLTVRDWAQASTSESNLLTGAWYDTAANHKLWADPATGLRRGDHFTFSVDISQATYATETYVDSQTDVPVIFVEDISDHSSMSSLNKLEVVAQTENSNYALTELTEIGFESWSVTIEPIYSYLLRMPVDCTIGQNYYAAFKAVRNADTPLANTYYSAVKIECEETLVYQTIESFEADLTADYPTKVHYKTVNPDTTTAPYLATGFESNMVRSASPGWVESNYAIVAEFDNVRNGDIVAFKFDLDGKADTILDLQMSPPLGSSYNYLNFISYMDLSIESTNQIATTAFSWEVPLSARHGDVFWGGFRFQKDGAAGRYLSVKVNIVKPTFYPDVTTWTTETALTVFDSDLVLTTLPTWMKTTNPTGWALESGNFLVVSDPIIDGETVGIAFNNADWSVEVLPIDADTAGAGHASVCELILYGQVDTRNSGADVYPAFAFQIPVGTTPAVNCYAALKLTKTSDSSVYFGALTVSVVVPNIQTNRPWLNDLPHSADGYTPETSTVDGGYYADSFDVTKVTISYTRQAGEYVVFSFKDDVEIIPRLAKESDPTLSDLIVVSAVITKGMGYNTYNALGADSVQAWPHLLLRVPTDAVEGSKYYGSIEIDDGISSRFALVEVTVSPSQIKSSVASVENMFASGDQNFVTNDVSPTVTKVWTGSPNLVTTNLQMNVDASSFYIFDVGADSEIDLAPKDSLDQELNAPIFDVSIIYQIEADQSSQVRARTAHVIQFAGSATDLAGLTFYLTLKTTTGNKYWSVAMTFQRSFAFSSEALWQSSITTADRFGNYEVMDYSEVDKYMMRGVETTHIVAEVPLAVDGMLALTFSGLDWSTSSITILDASTITDEIGNLWNRNGVAQEYSHLITSQTISQDKLGYAWAVPSDATLGSSYYIGISATVSGVVSTGLWKIVIVSQRNSPFETSQDFVAALTTSTTTFKYTTMEDFHDSSIEAAKFPVEQLQLSSGEALAIQIDIPGVTATVPDLYKAVDQFGGLLNDHGKVLIANSLVAKRSPTLFDAPIDDEPVTDDTTPTDTTDDTTATDETTAQAGDETGDETTETTDDTTTTTPAESDEGIEEEATSDVSGDPSGTSQPEPTGEEGEVTSDVSDEPSTTIDETATTDEETTPESAEEEVVTWSPLTSEATRYIYPSFAWVVPDSAAVGEVLYVQVNVAKGSSDIQYDNYFGVFEVTVVAPTELVEEVETEEEDSTLVATILIVTGVVLATAAIFYFFIV